MTKEVLIATTNEGKARVYAPVFEKAGIKILTLRDFAICEAPEENGASVIENAIIKAKFYYEKTGVPVLANDSGLIIHKFAPEDQPGLFVRRNKGKDLSDNEMIAHFSRKLQEVGGSSTGHYNVGLAIIDEKGNMHTKLFQPKRLFVSKASPVIQKGIPLNSLCYDTKSKRYTSEMTMEERNKNEGKAFEAQAKFILKHFS